MNTQTSDRIEQIVTRAQKQAEKAMEDFDFDAARIQISSSSSIDLFGGTATSQVADIATDVRRVCDKLYATLQMLVKMVDEECKPLLNQQPSMSAVKKVADLIKWLNSESEIGANFGASVNSKNLGTMVSGRYIPTMEAKMIQSYWETKYSTWTEWFSPSVNTISANNKAKRKTEKTVADTTGSELLKNLEIADSRRDFRLTAEELAYKEAVIRWRNESSDAEKKLEDEVTKRVEETKQKLNQQAKVQYDNAVAAQTQIIQEMQNTIETAQATIDHSNFFQISLRKTEQAKINKAIQCQTEAAEAVEKAKRTYNRTLAHSGKTAELQRESIRKKVFASYTKPEAPQPPESICILQTCPDAIKKAIIANMEPGRYYSLTDMRQEIAFVMNMSPQRHALLAKSMVPDMLERIEVDGKAYFRVNK